MKRTLFMANRQVTIKIFLLNGKKPGLNVSVLHDSGYIGKDAEHYLTHRKLIAGKFWQTAKTP